MGEGRGIVAMGAAAVACALLSSTAFMVARDAIGAPAGVPQRVLRSSQPQLASTTSASDTVCASVAVGLTVGLVAAAARRSMTRRAAAELETTETFAGGLAGSEYSEPGQYQWDPLFLAEQYPDSLPWFREAELKHGRVSMLAFLGLIVPDFVRIPVDVFSSSDLDAVTAHKMLIGPGLGEGPMWWLLIFCGTIESIRFKQLGLGFEKLTLESAGDLGFGKGFLPTTEEGITQIKVKELKNGRLAMLAFGGAITQAVLWDSHHFPFVP